MVSRIKSAAVLTAMAANGHRKMGKNNNRIRPRDYVCSVVVFLIAVECILLSSSTMRLGSVVSRGVEPPSPLSSTVARITANQSNNSITTTTAPAILSKCLSEPGPPGIILMSLGRSGSTVVWSTLTALTKSPPRFKVQEYVGKNQPEIKLFFDLKKPAKKKTTYGSRGGRRSRSIDHVPGKGGWKINGEWLGAYVCHLRKKNKGQAAFVGFKWKPSPWFQSSEEVRETLRLVASLATVGATQEQPPPIRIVRSRRNPLDVALSRLKHTESKQRNQRLGSHCKAGDEKCLSKLSVGKRYVSDIPGLYLCVRSAWEKGNKVDDLLRSLGVPVVFVSYDTLFYPENVAEGESEWNRALRFVSPSSPVVSWADVQGAIQHAATTPSRNHDDLIDNWRAVYAAFNGTELEHLFRLH
jgi:hypothetical protein